VKLVATDKKRGSELTREGKELLEKYTISKSDVGGGRQDIQRNFVRKQATEKNPADRECT